MNRTLTLLDPVTAGQVRKHDVALVHNEGGILSSNCTMLLGREAR